MGLFFICCMNLMRMERFSIAVLLCLQLSCIAANLFEFTTDKRIIRVGGPTVQYLHHPKEQGGKQRLKAEFSASDVDLSGPFKLCKAPHGGQCLQWGDDSNAFKLKIRRVNNCDQMSVEAVRNDSSVQATISYGEAQWYGGPERYVQNWPIQTLVINDPEPLVTRESNSQGVVEAYWLSSEGDSVYVRPNITLFWFSNKVGYEKQLGLIASNDAPYKSRGPPVLEFEMCSFSNAVEAHYNAIANYLGKPQAHPGKRMMTYPTYSTWAREKSNINQEKVLNFTNSILDNEYLLGQIEIDDKWEPCYGDLVIDTNRFPNITQLTDYIHSKGGRVTVWVHPFINVECEFYEQALAEGRLMVGTDGNTVSSWWNGQGGVVDFSNTTTKNWWVARLQQLKESAGLDGFKFDAGESSFYPQLPQITGDAQMYPESVVRNFVEAVAEFGEDLEVRVGHNTQDVPLFIRMLDKDSRWGLDNGLQSVLTTSFQMGIAGYPFILPDMIGGNAYGFNPPKELYIRWVQANTFLPAMQFSILPWDYDEEIPPKLQFFMNLSCTELRCGHMLFNFNLHSCFRIYQQTTAISKKYLDLRTSYSDYLLQESNVTISDGRPLVAPVWWYYPEDAETFAIRDQYMVGEGLLVAPVVEEVSTKRNIYIPSGSWTSARNETTNGPTWLRDYDAPLEFLPYFVKVQSSA